MTAGLVLIPNDLLEEASTDELETYRRYLDIERTQWRFIARPEQLTPEGDWQTWYVRGGRGGGKTRTGAENFAEWVYEWPGEWAVVAPTYGDARDVCIEGPSGLIQAIGRNRIRTWNRSLGEMRLRNGSTIWADGADDGALRIQGRNLRGAWCDEIGLWKRWEVAWDESVGFAVRLIPARIIATATPKVGMPAHKLVLRLIADPSVAKSQLRTRDNIANLSPARIRELEERYAGTRLGRQELEGDALTDIPGALWTPDMIEQHRVVKPPQRRWLDRQANDWAYADDLERVVIGVDPATTSGPSADETGIVVAAKGVDGRGYVLADRSCQLSPDGWGRRVLQACQDYAADCVVVERNQGGEMCEQVLRTAAQAMGMVPPRIKAIHAAQSKRLRAEPIAALYEQGRVSHTLHLEQLEDELCSYTPESGFSPDRLDALVHALSELMLHGAGKLRFRSGEAA